MAPTSAAGNDMFLHGKWWKEIHVGLDTLLQVNWIKLDLVLHWGAKLFSKTLSIHLAFLFAGLADQFFTSIALIDHASEKASSAE